MLESDVADGATTEDRQEVQIMSKGTIVSAARSAALAGGFIAIVVAGIAVRDAQQAAPTLGAADDYGTRHEFVVQAAPLTIADDFGTRHGPKPLSLGLADDYGTRNQPQAVELTEADDYGTRNQPQAVELTEADDFGTRHAK